MRDSVVIFSVYMCVCVFERGRGRGKKGESCILNDNLGVKKGKVLAPVDRGGDRGFFIVCLVSAEMETEGRKTSFVRMLDWWAKKRGSEHDLVRPVLFRDERQWRKGKQQVLLKCSTGVQPVVVYVPCVDLLNALLGLGRSKYSGQTIIWWISMNCFVVSNTPRNSVFLLYR